MIFKRNKNKAIARHARWELCFSKELDMKKQVPLIIKDIIMSLPLDTRIEYIDLVTLNGYYANSNMIEIGKNKEETINNLINKSEKYENIHEYCLGLSINNCKLKSCLTIHIKNRTLNNIKEITCFEISVGKEEITNWDNGLRTKDMKEIKTFLKDFAKRYDAKFEEKEYVDNKMDITKFRIEKEILNYCKHGTLKWISWDVDVVGKRNEKGLFKTVEEFCTNLPKRFIIREIEVYSTDNIKYWSLKSIKSLEDITNKIKEIENSLNKESKSIKEYIIYIEIDKSKLYNPIKVMFREINFFYTKEKGVNIYISINLEKMNMFTRKKIKPKDLVELDKYLKEMVARSKLFVIKYNGYDYSKEWEEKLDIYNDYFRKDISKRALKLLKNKRLENFSWYLYITKINGKEINLEHWRDFKTKKEDYNIIKKAVKMVIDNLPKESSINSVEFVFYGEIKKRGVDEVIEGNSKEDYIKKIYKNVDSIKSLKNLDFISINVDFENIKDLFYILIYPYPRSMSREWPINCKVVMPTEDDKINEKHIKKVHKWVNNLLKKNIGFELDFVTYEEE